MGSIKEMLSCKTWAVVGANNDTRRFGYKIFKHMLDCGMHVYPVNPGETEVYGQRCYSALKDLPEKPDAVNVVVKAEIGEKVMQECAELGISNVWLQPGADKPQVVSKAHELGLNVVCGCILLEAGR